MTEPKQKLSREEIANLEVGKTTVSRAQAWVLIVVFLLIAGSVAPIQAWLDRPDRPQALDVFAGLPKVAEAFRAATLPDAGQPADPDAGLFRRIKVANDQMLINIHDYEEEQKSEDGSFLTTSLITPAQTLTTRWMGQGNEKGYPGHDGWAFFRDGVDSLTGPGFLEPKQLERRAESGSEWQTAPQPDPRKAILAFHSYLEKRGIQLVLFPAPVKATVHPEMLSGRYDGNREPVQNPSFGQFVDELTNAGVTVFNPAPMLVAADGPHYLETDTHWRPDAMEKVAAALAKSLSLPKREPVDYQRETEELTALGDIAANLLKLGGTGVFEEQTVTIHPIPGWTPDESADLLLLGDSFANIFSVTNLGWGTDAGLAEQLSYELKRPIDRIAKNDAGAFATCRELEKALLRGDRLANKKVVIWEFATRELSVGDWQVIDWDSIEIGSAAQAQATDPSGARITGTIRQVTLPPQPGTVTYKDCITEIHLSDISGAIADEEVVVYLLGMQNNKWTDAANLQVGQTVELLLTDWDTAAEDPALATMRHEPLEDPDLELALLPLYWGEPVP